MRERHREKTGMKERSSTGIVGLCMSVGVRVRVKVCMGESDTVTERVKVRMRMKGKRRGSRRDYGSLQWIHRDGIERIEAKKEGKGREGKEYCTSEWFGRLGRLGYIVSYRLGTKRGCQAASSLHTRTVRPPLMEQKIEAHTVVLIRMDITANDGSSLHASDLILS
jgi:hypothetical protein